MAPIQKETTTRPSIVFILCDNIGLGDFSCYGGSIPTPRIDKLASEGIRFNNYTVESQCTPTKNALFADKMDNGWMLALVMPPVVEYQKSIAEYPNIKPGEEFTGYKNVTAKSA
ncbi:MAG: sulfatase-like hydrolase/transferase [Candidatus Acidiferrales bacterium]